MPLRYKRYIREKLWDDIESTLKLFPLEKGTAMCNMAE